MPTAFTYRVTTIAQEAVSDQLNTDVESSFGSDAHLVLKNKLSADGTGDGTHRWCGWQMTLAQLVQFSAIIDPYIDDETVAIYDGNQYTADEVLSQASLAVIITDLVAGYDGPGPPS